MASSKTFSKLALNAGEHRWVVMELHFISHQSVALYCQTAFMYHRLKDGQFMIFCNFCIIAVNTL